MTKNAESPSDSKILDVAAHLFRDRGFHATPLRDIARGSNVFLGSLYYRYPTKEHILLALAKRAVQRGTERIEAAIAQGRDPLDRARLGLQTYLELLLSEEDSIYVLLNEWRTSTLEVRRELARCQNELDKLCDRMFADAQKIGLVNPGINPELLRLFAFGAANWTAQWYHHGRTGSPSEIADALLVVLGAGVLSEKGRGALAAAGLSVDGMAAAIRQLLTPDAADRSLANGSKARSA